MEKEPKKPAVWLSNAPQNVLSSPDRRTLVETLETNFSVQNKQGNQKIHPSKVQKDVFDAHQAFVFGPSPSPQDRYLSSCFLACLTKNDTSLTNKPVIIVNSDRSWDDFIAAVNEFKAMGVSKNALSDTITVVDDPKLVASIVKDKLDHPLDLGSRSSLHSTTIHPTRMEELRLRNDIPEPKHKVVVFCSASLKATPENASVLDANAYIQSFKELGRKIAEKGWGIVYGGGAHALMGALAEGAAEKNGWVEVVTLKRFFEREGLPNDQFSKVSFATDVHARVTDMAKAKGVSAFVIGPGTEGTLHEAETINGLLHEKDSSMKTVGGRAKPTYMLALPKHEPDTHFWTGAAERLGYERIFDVQPSVDALIDKIEKDKFSVPYPRVVKSAAAK